MDPLNTHASVSAAEDRHDVVPTGLTFGWGFDMATLFTAAGTSPGGAV